VPASAWVARDLGCERVIYHCVDEFSQFAGAGDEIAALEADLCHASDLVIACSEPLYRSKARLNANTILVRHGVEQAHFARALDEKTPIPDDVRDLPRPIFGFYGLVAEWVDLEAVRQIAAAWPEGSVILVGETNNANAEALARLRALGNVHILGHRPYDALPGYCKSFDVALLPFVKNVLTENANPLKLREYLAAGLPVVATDIPEARALADHGVLCASASNEFVALARRALEIPPSRARSEAMARESWDHKVAEIEERLLSLE
jgi:glycosyltransferase involved in cell wall biosynthesis